MASAVDFLEAPPPKAEDFLNAPAAENYLAAPATSPDELPGAHDAAPSWFSAQWDYLKGLPEEINNRLGKGEFEAASKMIRGAQWGIGKLYDVADAVMPNAGAGDSKRDVSAVMGDLADKVDGFSKQNFKPDSKYKADLSANITQMVGDLGTTLGFGKLLTVPGAFALSSGQAGAEEAIAAGRPDLADQARLKQGAIGAVAGIAFPEAATLERAASGPIKAIVKSAAEGAKVTALQTAGTNVAAQDYDPNRSILQGVPEAAAAGGMIGGAMHALPEMLANRGGAKARPMSAEDYLVQPDRPPVEPAADTAAATEEAVQTPGPAAPEAATPVETLNPMDQRALQGALLNAGLSPEEVAGIRTVEEAHGILSSAPPPRPPSELSAEDIARREYEQEMLSQADAGQADHGADLLDAIISAGGLPSLDSPHRAAYRGELDSLAETAKDPTRAEPIPLNRLFRKNAQSVDRLATSLRDQGFPTMTPDDVLNIVDERLRSGRPIYGQPELARTFASGAAAPRAAAKPGPGAGAPGGAAPHQPAPPRNQPPALPPPSSPAVRAAAAPVRSWWQQRTLGIRKLVAPQTIDAPAAKVGNIIRDYNGRLANKIIQADHALEAARGDFDKTPVPANWVYDPNKPLPRNYAFMAKSERGGAALSSSDQALKAQMDGMFAEAVNEVHRVKPAALKSLIQDYFPHIWQDPAAAKRAFASIVGTRPLEGPKAFLKQRSLAYVEDGLKMGLKPVSDNPIDMVLTKLHEVHKFVAAQDMLAEAKAIGARKFVYIFEKPPDGWVKVDDPTSTVHGPPFVTVPEAFDAQMKAKTLELLDQLKIPHDRVKSLGGKRWGTFTHGGAGIKTKFAGPLSVYWHELGHGLQERYGWLDTILRGENPAGKTHVATELRALADLRSEGLPPNKSFKSYIRSADEKAAVMLEAYMHAPGRMQDVAPVIYGRVQKFIQAHPELHAIEDIRPSLVLGSAKQQIDVGGMVTLGNYYMPEGAAAVFNNYLSPGLQRFGIVRSIRNSTNILSSAQLGFSAFHAGFTSLDAIVSQFAAGLQHATEGRFREAAARVAAAPVAPVLNYYTGKAIQRAMIDPSWAGRMSVLGKEIQLSPHGQARAEDIAQLAVKAGLRATVDPFWKTQVTRNMMRSWHAGGVKGFAGTVLRLPFAASEQMMRPILEYLVPRQKLGVFAGIANAGMEQLSPNADIHDVRAMLAQAADSTEDRMGQMTYDNLFYNRVIRDAALIGFRAYGWTYGKYRAFAGAIADTVQTPGRMKEGGPLLTPRMAYAIALPMTVAAAGSIMNYLMTGQAPQDWRDMLMPRTGKLDINGNPQRISPPTYIKDILSDSHAFPNPKKMLVSLSHKLNPWISIGADLINNADFMNTKIANEDDSWLKQQGDRVAFVLKSMVPFSVTGAAKLRESDPSLMQQIMPFFGFVPAKAELSMSPAQIRAAELMHDALPQGARTADQAERSKMVSQLMRDMKEQDPKWQSEMGAALGSGQLPASRLGSLFKNLPLTPFQYQVKKLNVDGAMKVWDLATPDERQQIRAIIVPKLGASKTLTPDQRAHYYQVLTKPPGS